ncbi:hypothetical protein C8R45DRAFT_978955 [Mycena sanguinolenta]|nr:hypothetical protein C8R45DRAFT_978955 [Mycena sanguinolenta]
MSGTRARTTFFIFFALASNQMVPNLSLLPLMERWSMSRSSSVGFSQSSSLQFLHRRNITLTARSLRCPWLSLALYRARNVS